jgi:MraZ protein
MFQGEHINTMDDKGRVSIPAVFREFLRSGFDDESLIITRDYDGCLRAYPPREWDRGVLANIRSLNIEDPWRRSYERYVVSPAVTCLPDRQGRILLPQTLRDHAGLNRTVLFAGGASHFEIWDSARREARLQEDLALLQQGRPSS